MTGLTKVEHLASELQNLNDEVGRDQRAFLRSAQRLNAMDDHLMNDQTEEEPSDTQEERGSADQVARAGAEEADAQGFVLEVSERRAGVD